MFEAEKPDLNENKVHQAISGIPYPASKEELISYASARSRNGVIDLLQKLPELEYQNEPQVLSTLEEYMDA